jgi:hypothetical protein
MVFTGYPSRIFSRIDAWRTRGDSARSAIDGNSLRQQPGGRPTRSVDWTTTGGDDRMKTSP